MDRMRKLIAGYYRLLNILLVISVAVLIVPVTISQSGSQSTASGEFVVKRLDFKIGENEWADLSLVANDVRVRFKLVFTGLGPL